MKQIQPPTEIQDVKARTFFSVITYVVDKPQSLAVIFALVMLGMFIGIIPSTFLKSQQEVAVKVDTLITNQATLLANQNAAKERADNRQESILAAIQATNNNSAVQTEKLIQIIRGMCLLIAKQSNDSAALSYCNPAN
jgi:hypothetical protein